jgi:hypothetical protein
MGEQAGFHPGELEVQRRAGLHQQAMELVGMLAPPVPSPARSRWLAERNFAVLTARDCAGRLWTAPLVGPPGFLDLRGDRVAVYALPSGLPEQPPAGQRVGLIVIDPQTRKRLRINGSLIQVGPDWLGILIEQAYGNCQKYIQARSLEFEPTAAQRCEPKPASDAEVADFVAAADTFFLGTTHPERGPDTSHRGGRPGFLRLDADGLWWPDYRGNNIFNSFGNLVVDHRAALLIADFRAGRILQLSGTAVVEWGKPGDPGDDGLTGRRGRFRVAEAVTADMPVHADAVAASPVNPALRD